MIVHLSPEENTNIRRQLLTDVVYAISHDALDEMHPSHTELTKVEIYVSAQAFAKEILKLSDVEEGLNDEIKELCNEANSEDEAMLILVLAAIMLQAVDQNNPTQQVHDIVLSIFTRVQDNPLFLPLLTQFANKEVARFAKGKITNLVNYELASVTNDEEAIKAIRAIVQGMLANMDKAHPDTIKETIILLERFNLDHHNIIDAEIDNLYKQLGYKSQNIIEIKELVQHKYVQNEVQNVESGATGIISK